jgi:hypothetical protein
LRREEGGAEWTGGNNLGSPKISVQVGFQITELGHNLEVARAEERANVEEESDQMNGHSIYNE